jgi:hypothetical protein
MAVGGIGSGVAARSRVDVARAGADANAVDQPTLHAITPSGRRSTSIDRMLLRTVTTRQARAGERLLATADIGAPRGRIGGGNDSRVRLHQLRGAGIATGRPIAVKSVVDGGAHEAFAYDVAKAMRIDHMLPVVALRGEGVAAMELLSGRTLGDKRVGTPTELQSALEAAWRARQPSMGAAEVARRATVERRLMQAFDYVIANGDRHAGNAMLETGPGDFRLIDHALINRYPAGPDGLVPKLRAQFMTGPEVTYLGKGVHEIELEPEVREVLARTDRAAIGSAFERLLAATHDVRGFNGHVVRPDPAHLDQLLARLDHAAATGRIRFRTI